MHYKRVIPCMDVDAGRVVKGTKFIDIRDAGDPVELAAHYDAAGADEVSRVAEAVRGRFLYSGGIGARDDLSGLAGLRQVNLAGVVVGKALYEGRFTIAEGQAALDAL